MSVRIEEFSFVLECFGINYFPLSKGQHWRMIYVLLCYISIWLFFFMVIVVVIFIIIINSVAEVPVNLWTLSCLFWKQKSMECAKFIQSGEGSHFFVKLRTSVDVTVAYFLISYHGGQLLLAIELPGTIQLSACNAAN